MDLMTQIYAIVIFGILTVALPTLLNSWADSRSGVR